MMAGSSITSHSSIPLLWIEDFKIAPVKSLLCQRVITMMMDPPGWRRCLGPDVYHSWTRSNTDGSVL